MHVYVCRRKHTCATVTAGKWNPKCAYKYASPTRPLRQTAGNFDKRIQMHATLTACLDKCAAEIETITICSNNSNANLIDDTAFKSGGDVPAYRLRHNLCIYTYIHTYKQQSMQN